MGMKNSSGVFQKCMEQLLKGVPGVIVYQDDMMLCADSDRQLKNRLGEVYKRLRENSVTVNSEKCIPSSDSLKFLGFVFSAAGIQPDTSLTSKIADADVPKSLIELAAFFGLVTNYGKFCNNFSDLCAPSPDASKKAVGCVMSQDGHPVLYVSRKLTLTEAQYSNIEREALIWSCERLRHFLLGKKFCIETDHKTLLYIFDPEQALKSDISPVS